MLTIAIVEDSARDAARIIEYIDRWRSEEETETQVSTFVSSTDFLIAFQGQFDIVFLDIMLPDKNGVDTAKIIRETDSGTVIIFTTNMMQYAINGYEVDALDFILKPVLYTRFALSMKKAVARLELRRDDRLVLRIPGITYRVNISDICYVEVKDHYVYYNLLDGQSIRRRGTMTEAENSLPRDGFARCSVSYLINLRHVDRIDKEYVTVNGIPFKITRGQNKEFRNALVRYYAK